MPEPTEPSGGRRPLRVVVFTGGPVLEPAVVELIARLVCRPEIDLAGVYCEARDRGTGSVVRDLWRRRGALAPPLLLQRWLRELASAVFTPRVRARRRGLVDRLGPVVRYVGDLHAPAVTEALQALEPDLGVVYGGPILREHLFSIPRRGTLGIHHGRVPDYRGKKTTFWAMYHGEETVGVTIQRIGSGLDAGDVLLEAELRVGRAPLSLVRRRLERLGLDLYVEALLRVHRGEARFRPQPAGPGRLYSDPGPGDLLRFWLRYLRRIVVPRGSGGRGNP